MPPQADPVAEAARAARIAELEASLARPAGIGVAPWVAALALLILGYMLWQQRADTSYFFSSRDPVQLGAEGDYRFEAAIDNRYVELHGIPTSKGAFGQDGKEIVVAVGVRDTPVMVWRRALSTEDWKPGTKPPPPNQQPFTVRGRLISRAEAPAKYSEGFARLDDFGEVTAKWVLVESARPGTDMITIAVTTLLMAMIGFSAWLLMRGLIVMLSVKKPTT